MFHFGGSYLVVLRKLYLLSLDSGNKWCSLCDSLCISLYSFWHILILRDSRVGSPVLSITSVYDSSGWMIRNAHFWILPSVVAWSSVIPACHSWQAYSKMGRSIVTYIPTRSSLDTPADLPWTHTAEMKCMSILWDIPSTRHNL